MTHKLNISSQGKAWKLELEPSILNGKSIGDKIQGKDIKQELENYELTITGGSDLAGFPMLKNAEGIGRKKELFTLGWGLHKKPKGEKKKGTKPKGLRLRKTVAGNTIHDKTVQINLNVIKEGPKPLKEIFPDQNIPKEEPKAEEKAEAPKVEEKIAEEIKEEVKEEIKENIPTSPETKTEEKKEETAEEIAEEVKEEVQEVAKKIAEESPAEDKKE